MDLIPSKTCVKCGKSKPLGQFRFHAFAPDKLRYSCKMCENQAAKEVYERNKEKKRRKMLQYNKTNKNALYWRSFGIGIAERL